MSTPIAATDSARPVSSTQAGTSERRRDSRRRHGLLSACAIVIVIVIASLATPAALAQNYPARPIRLVLPFPPGGAIDIMGRIVAQGLTPRAGQAVVVENRSGAGGLLGAEAVAKSAPDGYTLCYCSAGGMVTSPLIVAKPPYDPRRDFAPVTLVATVPYLVLTHPSEGPKNIQELLSRAKQAPGKLNFGSAGVGSTSHLAAAQFVSASGIDVVHIPFKGAAQAASELMANRLQFVFEAIGSSVQYTQSGRLKVIGLTTIKRSPMLPDVPTVSEQGLSGFEMTVWHAIMTPAGVPKPAIDWLNREIIAAISTADVRERFAAAGGDLVTSTPEELRERLDRELTRWEPILTRLGLREK